MNDANSLQDQSVEELLGRIADEFSERRARGEQPDVEAYATRYPELAGMLRRVLPTVQAMCELSSNSPAADSPDAEAIHLGRLGDYRIVRQIGRGGMGIVYEAEQLSIGRRVALKVLPFAAMLDPKQLQRFKNEVHAAGQLHHTNIVPVFSVGCERGVHYYAMQYIEGGTLADVIRELRQAAGLNERGDEHGLRSEDAQEFIDDSPDHPKQPSMLDAPRSATLAAHTASLSTERSTSRPAFFRTAAKLGIQAADALEHAHQLGVVHRDVKPSNLLVDTRGDLWITDFGLARSLQDADLTMTGDLLGTIRYMSPEQALAKRALVDHRTDIYSLGATLYELLTMEPAFDGRDRQELLRQIAWDEPRLPRRLNKTVPAELETIVLKAMSKSPSSRYATAQELADDLRRFLDDKPIHARRPTLVDRFMKWARRHRPVVVTAAGSGIVLLVAAVVGLAISNQLIVRERDQRDFALREKDAALRDRESALAASQASLAEAKAQRDRADLNFQKARDAVDNYFTQVSEGTLLDVPGLQPLRKELLESALKYHQAFLEQRSPDPELRADLAASYFRVAQIYTVLDRNDDAVRAIRQGLELAESLVREYPDRLDLPRRLAGFYKTGRLVQRETRPPSDPLTLLRSLRQGAELWEKFVRDDPTGAELRHDLAGIHGYLGEVLLAMRQDAEALDSFGKASNIWEQLVDENPTVADYQSDLAGSHYRIGTLLNRVDRRQEAHAAFRRALELREKLADNFPTRAQYRLELAESYNQLGRRLIVAENYSEAEEVLSRAVAGLSMLAADFPSVPIYRDTLGISLTDLGSLFRRKGQLPDAVAAYRRAVELAAESATLPRQRDRLAHRYDLLSLVLADCGEASEAEKSHRKALAIQESLVADFPAVARYEEELCWLVIIWPESEARHVSRAVELATKAVERKEDNGSLLNLLGGAHYRAGNWAAARVALEKAIASRANKSTFFFLAMTHWKQGDPAEARNDYHQAVEWMEKNMPHDERLMRLRAEAAELLSIERDESEVMSWKR